MCALRSRLNDPDDDGFLRNMSRSSSFVWAIWKGPLRKFFMMVINHCGEVTNRLNKRNLQYCFDFDVNFGSFSLLLIKWSTLAVRPGYRLVALPRTAMTRHILI